MKQPSSTEKETVLACKASQWMNDQYAIKFLAAGANRAEGVKISAQLVTARMPGLLITLLMHHLPLLGLFVRVKKDGMHVMRRGGKICTNGDKAFQHLAEFACEAIIRRLLWRPLPIAALICLVFAILCRGDCWHAK